MEDGHETKTLIANTKAWIEQQEKTIQKMGHAPQLTKEQVQALKLLCLPQTPTLPEPDLAGENWVGLLMEYHQANPSGKSPEFLEISVSSPPTLRWQCRVVIANHPDPFPRPEDWKHLGYASMPSWAKKKEAKQYACKCAFQWLSSWNENGGTSIGEGKEKKKNKNKNKNKNNKNEQGTFPSNAPESSDGLWRMTPSLSSAPDEHDDQIHDCEESLEPQRPISPATPRDSSSNDSLSFSSTGTSAMSIEDIPMTQQVVDLCNWLKVTIPVYEITPSKSGGSGSHRLFDGHASWGYDAPANLPSKVGVVSGVLSKKGCREKVAEEILKVLKQVAQERTKNVMRALAG